MKVTVSGRQRGINLTRSYRTGFHKIALFGTLEILGALILAKKKTRLQEPAVELGTLETFETLILRKRKSDCKSLVRIGALEILGGMALAYHKKR
jgi:hypothetical protein